MLIHQELVGLRHLFLRFLDLGLALWTTGLPILNSFVFTLRLWSTLRCKLSHLGHFFRHKSRNSNLGRCSISRNGRWTNSLRQGLRLVCAFLPNHNVRNDRSFSSAILTTKHLGAEYLTLLSALRRERSSWATIHFVRPTPTFWVDSAVQSSRLRLKVGGNTASQKMICLMLMLRLSLLRVS